VRIYLPLTVLAVVLVISGFWPRYFWPLLTGTVHKPTIIHVHAAVFVGWLMVLATQAWLAATRRTALHMKVGTFAFAYALVVLAVGLATGLDGFATRLAAGRPDAARHALLLPVTDMTLFVVFMSAAWSYRLKPEIHKRLIVVATTGVILPGAGRLPFWHGTQIFTVQEVVPFLLVWLSLIYIAMIHDYVKKKIIHPVYVIGLLSLIALRFRSLMADSAGWTAFTDWLGKLYV
jgi:hypothetical protein